LVDVESLNCDMFETGAGAGAGAGSVEVCTCGEVVVGAAHGDTDVGVTEDVYGMQRKPGPDGNVTDFRVDPG